MTGGNFNTLHEKLRGEIQLCLSCNACRTQCTVNTATDRLRPLSLVRAANMGLRAELQQMPEIWYCVQCQRCSGACPLSVSPSELIRCLRREAEATGLLDPAAMEAHEALGASLQRVRWHVTARLLAGEEDMEVDWDRLAARPVPVVSGAVTQAPGPDLRAALEQALGLPVGLASCLSCGQCTSTCPVAHQRSVFDPSVLFRMAALGLADELLRSPAIWLCLGCQACTAACVQGVNGHQVLQALQGMALAHAAAPAGIRRRLQRLERHIYGQYLERVDRLLEDA